MKNGVYALASLDGRPPSPRDRTTMGLTDKAFGMRSVAGCLMLPQDVRRSAVHVYSGSDLIDVLLGDLDEPEDAARTLGLAPTTDPLTIARNMVERFGDRAPRRLLGNWILVRWDVRSATMTLLMAERVRDTCYVATDGVRLAVSPELIRLARLDWVDATPDPTDFLLSMGRAHLRTALGDRTMLRGVVRVMPGTRVTVRLHERHASIAEPPSVPAVASAVSFDEAIETIDDILRRVMRQHFEREGDSALSLSGGLDSSLVALYAAQERGSRALTFLTSAASPASGLADESHFAEQVASHLGVAFERVVPSPSANVYRPSVRMLAQVETPLMTPRHYVDEALEQAALERGAHALLNGYGGEMTVTNHGEFLERAQVLRDVARSIRDRIHGTADTESWPHAQFHVRPSVAALDHSADDLRDLARRSEDLLRRLNRRSPFGFEIDMLKVAVSPSTTVDHRLRSPAPFHDRRLLYYVATLPAGFARQGGHDRALARHLLKGRLPDSIVWRRRGMPYSPAYQTMVVEQAEAARKRIPLFHEHNLGQWLDLSWLDDALAAQMSRARRGHVDALKIQMTAISAEFLLWWSART